MYVFQITPKVQHGPGEQVSHDAVLGISAAVQAWLLSHRLPGEIMFQINFKGHPEEGYYLPVNVLKLSEKNWLQYTLLLRYPDCDPIRHLLIIVKREIR